MADTRDLFQPTIDRINSEELREDMAELHGAMGGLLSCFKTNNRPEFIRGAIMMAMYLSLDQTVDHAHQETYMEVAKTLTQDYIEKEFNWYV